MNNPTSEEPVYDFSNNDLILRAYEGEVFVDDGWRFQPLLHKYLRDLNELPSTRKSGVYSPSAMGKCARKAYYNRVGVPKKPYLPPEKRLLFDLGHAVQWQYNNYITDMLAKGYFGEDTVLLNHDLYYGAPAIIGGEADFLLLQREGGKPKRVIDFKTSATDSFGKLRTPTITPDGVVIPDDMKTYVWQVMSYQAMFGAPYGTLYYINKNNSLEKELSFVFSIAVWEQFAGKVSTIENHIAVGTIPDYETNPFCRECEFFYHCQPPGVK